MHLVAMARAAGILIAGVGFSGFVGSGSVDGVCIRTVQQFNHFGRRAAYRVLMRELLNAGLLRRRLILSRSYRPETLYAGTLAPTTANWTGVKA